MSKAIFNFLFIPSFFLITACGSNTIIDAQVDMGEGLWHIDSLASFDFEIEDNTPGYMVDYTVRYAVGYPYYNLYIKYYLEDSAGQIISSDMQELMLFDKKTGEPQGEGMGDLFDRRISVFPTQVFSYNGKYTYKVKQFMRMESLPGILSFGVKIEKHEED